MRITISWEEAEQLKGLCSLMEESIELTNEQKGLITLFSGRLSDEMAKEPSEKKRNATKKATDGRVKEAKLKIFNTLNMMRLEGKKININAVAREAGVSYNTAKKYRAVIESEKKK
jgi:hypothetical protein